MPKTPQTIGIMGGRFDPIHHGHLRVALEVCNQVGLDKLFLVPCCVPVHRGSTAAVAADRLAMIKLAISSEPLLTVDIREMLRKGVSYTIDTLTTYREQYAHNPLCLIIGADAWCEFASWHKWREILDYAHLIVVSRNGYSIKEILAELQDFARTKTTTDVQDIHQKSCGHILQLTVPELAISATAIRAMIKNGENPRYLLPDNVLQYIQDRKIYL